MRSDMKVTIMMVVHNGEKYIYDCMESISKQTFSDFELLIVNDGSTDRTREIIHSFKDSRIKLIDNTHDYIDSLNIGLNEANGEYIARIDADDIMLPERIMTQIELMENRKEVDVCASWATIFGKRSGSVAIYKHHIHYPIAKLLRANIFCHSTIMLRKDFLVRNKLMYKRYDYAEDYKLWTDIAIKGGVFYTVPKPLIRFRISDDQISFRKTKEQQNTAHIIQNELVDYILNHQKFSHKENLLKVYDNIYELNHQYIVSADTVRFIISRLYEDILTYNELGSICR